MSINNQYLSRRKVLKGIGVTGAAAVFPNLASAGCFGKKHSSEQFAVSTESGRLSIEFADAGASNVDASMVRVSISNSSDKTVKLSKVSPGAITVKGEEYNLNNQLAYGPISIEPNSVRYVWLNPSKYGAVKGLRVDDNVKGEMIVVNVIRGEEQLRDTQLAHVLIA